MSKKIASKKKPDDLSRRLKRIEQRIDEMLARFPGKTAKPKTQPLPSVKLRRSGGRLPRQIDALSVEEQKWALDKLFGIRKVRSVIATLTVEEIKRVRESMELTEDEFVRLLKQGEEIELPKTIGAGSALAALTDEEIQDVREFFGLTSKKAVKRQPVISKDSLRN